MCQNDGREIEKNGYSIKLKKITSENEKKGKSKSNGSERKLFLALNKFLTALRWIGLLWKVLEILLVKNFMLS